MMIPDFIGGLVKKAYPSVFDAAYNGLAVVVMNEMTNGDTSHVRTSMQYMDPRGLNLSNLKNRAFVLIGKGIMGITLKACYVYTLRLFDSEVYIKGFLQSKSGLPLSRSSNNKIGALAAVCLGSYAFLSFVRAKFQLKHKPITVLQEGFKFLGNGAMRALTNRYSLGFFYDFGVSLTSYFHKVKELEKAQNKEDFLRYIETILGLEGKTSLQDIDRGIARDRGALSEAKLVTSYNCDLSQTASENELILEKRDLILENSVAYKQWEVLFDKNFGAQDSLLLRQEGHSFTSSSPGLKTDLIFFKMACNILRDENIDDSKKQEVFKQFKEILEGSQENRANEKRKFIEDYWTNLVRPRWFPDNCKKSY